MLQVVVLEFEHVVPMLRSVDTPLVLHLLQ